MGGVLLNFDQSGAKYAIPDSKRNSQTESIIAGPPAGIPCGTSPVLQTGVLNAAETDMADIQLKYHIAEINWEKEANLLCTKYSAILQ